MAQCFRGVCRLVFGDQLYGREVLAGEGLTGPGSSAVADSAVTHPHCAMLLPQPSDEWTGPALKGPSLCLCLSFPAVISSSLSKVEKLSHALSWKWFLS